MLSFTFISLKLLLPFTGHKNYLKSICCETTKGHSDHRITFLGLVIIIMNHQFSRLEATWNKNYSSIWWYRMTLYFDQRNIFNFRKDSYWLKGPVWRGVENKRLRGSNICIYTHMNTQNYCEDTSYHRMLVNCLTQVLNGLEKMGYRVVSSSNIITGYAKFDTRNMNWVVKNQREIFKRTILVAFVMKDEINDLFIAYLFFDWYRQIHNIIHRDMVWTLHKAKEDWETSSK